MPPVLVEPMTSLGNGALPHRATGLRTLEHTARYHARNFISSIARERK